MKKIYVTGISGTGKTAIYEELKKKGFAAIEIDDLCCWVDKESRKKIKGKVELNKDFTSTHSWICDTGYLNKLLNEEEEKVSDIVFVLGAASNQNDYLATFDKVVLLQCKPDTFIHRLTHRTNNDFGKDKAVQDAMLGWYKDFENKLLQMGAISISTETSVDTAVEEVLKQTLFI